MPIVVSLVLLSAAVPAMLLLGRLFLRQDRIVFRPSGQGRDLEVAPAAGYQPVRLVDPGRSDLPAWWHRCDSSQWMVLYFHGSDGNVRREFGVADFLARLGVNALLVEYPGYHLERTRPSEQGCYGAGEAGWAFALGLGFPAERVILYGMSLGSAVATYLAADRVCGAIVVQSGFTCVPDLAARRYPYLPVRPFCRVRMSNLARIGAVGVPTLLIHSADDEHIPVAHAELLYERASGPKLLVLISGSHFGGSWRRSPAVLAAWRDLLDGRTASWSSARIGGGRHA